MVEPLDYHERRASLDAKQTYQLPEPITVTLCFLAKGVRDDILARTPSIMRGRPGVGRRAKEREKAGSLKERRHRLEKEEKSIKGNRQT